MSMKVRCRCCFDITATGVKHNFNGARLPFRDKTGAVIDSEKAWHRSRNQQRNWETLLQIISLRTLPAEVTDPRPVQDAVQKYWQFDFVVDQPGSLQLDGDPVGLLLNDSDGVPMHKDLNEDDIAADCLIPKGSGANVFFDVLEN